MSPTDKEFGELIGEVRGMRAQVTDLQDSNRREHEENGRRFEHLRSEVRESISTKADQEEVDEVKRDVVSLRETRAGNRARDSVLKGALGAALTFGAIILGNHVHIP